MIGTTEIDVTLHPQVKANKQRFVVVPKLDVILIGRDLLKKFNSLEVSWKCMELKIDGYVIPGSKVIKGGEVDSRILLGHEKPMRSVIKDMIDKEVDQNCNITLKDKNQLRSLLN